MLLLTLSSNQSQNFDKVQNYFIDNFNENFIKNCENFTSYGRKTKEISFLFLEKETHIFYSLPKCDEYDILILPSNFNIKPFINEIYKLLEGNIDISAYISYNNIRLENAQKDCIFRCLPENMRNEKSILSLFNKETINMSCVLYVMPYETQEILITINTYDYFISSITNIIDCNVNDFLTKFFNLVVRLMYGR